MDRKQATGRIIMIRPARFGFNTQTAINNSYQVHSGESDEEIAQRATREFDDYVSLLRKYGVEVMVLQDTLEPATPDSIFPNNWFSTHCTGELILYPMYAANRRLERKPEVVQTIRQLSGISKVYDLTYGEAEQTYLEGTGSMVPDRVHRIVYACISDRTHRAALMDFCGVMDYELIPFEAVNAKDQPIYHTNVMMSIATRYAVVCLEAITSDASRQLLTRRLQETGHDIIAITQQQVNAFAGNMLEVLGGQGESLILMSQAARNSLTPEQLERIERYSTILSPDLHIIETNGGGSARCMVAENFLPTL